MRRVHLILLLVVSGVIILASIITTFSQATLLQQTAAIFLSFLGGMAAIAEIIGLFDRLGIPETVIPPESKFILRDKSPCETTVAIWGPVGAGKTWLINALANTINTKYQKGYSGLRYDLFDANGNPSFGYSPTLGNRGRGNEIGPTAEITFSFFRFSRSRTSNKFFEMMSSFSHNIYIYDNQGGPSSNIGNEKVNQNRLAKTIVNLANADIVILALDPTRITEEEVSKTDYSYGMVTRKEYAEMVRRLFSVLEKANPEKRRLYAACITKSDLIPGAMYLHPDALVETYFGHEMSEALQTPKQGIVQTFTTSSFGFIGGTTKPNHDGGRIQDEYNWRPYGVEYPFFWSFEMQEKELLKKLLRSNLWSRLSFYSNYKNYIPYPKPKYEL